MVYPALQLFLTSADPNWPTRPLVQFSEAVDTVLERHPSVRSAYFQQILKHKLEATPVK